MRILAIDYGTVRVGTALSDELGILASPFRLLRYSRAVVEEIAKIVEEHNVGTVVVGMPTAPNGEDSLTVRQVRNFVERLHGALPNATVTTWDESRSTLRAVGMMQSAGVGRKGRREDGKRDLWAAALILQEYLEAERESRKRDQGSSGRN